MGQHLLEAQQLFTSAIDLLHGKIETVMLFRMLFYKKGTKTYSFC